LRHQELSSLAIAHLDCDAFYAAVEKRDDPLLADRPVIIGGGKRGVVSTACYLARTFGVRSAMPMFKALALCPDAAVLRPDMQKYGAVARDIREKMLRLTPLVEPLSIDEAFLDLSGTERVHDATPVESLARLQNEIERDIGVTVSIGLSHNKFLAKIASDLDKPRGFSVIGRAETRKRLAALPVTMVWGVGAKMAERLRVDGLATIGDVQRLDASILAARYGEMGLRLARLSVGDDRRRVDPEGGRKTVSAETTFNEDIRDGAALQPILWRLCEKVSKQLKHQSLSGRAVVLKLKDSRFQTITRRKSLERPTNLARLLYECAEPLLAGAVDGRPWRLIGVGAGDLVDGAGAGNLDLFTAARERRIEAQEQAMDAIREKFGDKAIGAGRSWSERRRS
jgi:DNA polymerase-4